MQGTRLPSLVGELRPRTSHSIAKNIHIQQFFHFRVPSETAGDKCPGTHAWLTWILPCRSEPSSTSSLEAHPQVPPGPTQQELGFWCVL